MLFKKKQKQQLIIILTTGNWSCECHFKGFILPTSSKISQDWWQEVRTNIEISKRNINKDEKNMALYKTKCLCPLRQITQCNGSFMHLVKSLKQKTLGSSVIAWRHSERGLVEILTWMRFKKVGDRWPKGFNYCDLHLGWLFLPPSWQLAQCASKRPSGTVCVSAKLQGRRCSPARSKATWRQCPEGACLVGQKDTWANTGYGGTKTFILKKYTVQRFRPNKKEKATSQQADKKDTYIS